MHTAKGNTKFYFVNFNKYFKDIYITFLSNNIFIIIPLFANSFCFEINEGDQRQIVISSFYTIKKDVSLQK